MKKTIETVVNILFQIVQALCKVILVFMVGTVAVQVFMRLFGRNIKWCEEVMLLLLDALMFLLMPIGMKEDLHIRVEVFAKRFARGGRKLVVVLSDAMQLMLSLCMIYYGNILVSKTRSVFTITGIPRKYLYTITVVGGVLCAIVSLLKLCGMLQTKTTQDFINGETDQAALAGSAGDAKEEAKDK